MTSKWDNRFLDLAYFISKWSKDPSTKVGAVIVDNDRRIVSTGYNGFPIGVGDAAELYANRDYKYEHVVHGEMNAILFARRDLNYHTLYTVPFMPCSRCAAMIIQSGIMRVVAPYSNNPRWKESFDRTIKLFTEGGVQLDIIPDTTGTQS